MKIKDEVGYGDAYLSYLTLVHAFRSSGRKSQTVPDHGMNAPDWKAFGLDDREAGFVRARMELQTLSWRK